MNTHFPFYNSGPLANCFLLLLFPGSSGTDTACERGLSTVKESRGPAVNESRLVKSLISMGDPRPSEPLRVLRSASWLKGRGANEPSPPPEPMLPRLRPSLPESELRKCGGGGGGAQSGAWFS